MTSTEYRPVVADTVTEQAPEQVIEQGEQVSVEPAAEPTGELVDVAEVSGPAESVAAMDVSEGLGAPLLVAFLGGMALVVAVLTPVAGARIGALLIVGVAVAIVCRLLARRGGGSR